MTASAPDRVLSRLPQSFPGPGGAAAVLKDGVVLERHAWGFANAERRIPFTPRTLFRMCSITKQFTCAATLDSFPDPTALDDDVAARLPRLTVAAPGALHLCHNQSGLRDYWAVAMLHGSPVEAPFGDMEAARVIAGTRTLQFEPGTRYSYVNQNFRLLSDIVQARTGRPFAELLRRRIFDVAGMESAILAADTRALPDATEGYEGSVATGFRAADNRIFWTGDAGMAASLDDMIAWEQFIDRTRDDDAGLYRRLSAPVTFADGSPASYGFGLGRRVEHGRAVTGHGGALRGWRSHRLYSRADRVSVVVMFNHLSDAQAAALDLFAAAVGATQAAPQRSSVETPPDWFGHYLEPQTGLATRLDAAGDGRARLRYGHGPELLDLTADGAASEAVTVRRTTDGLWMDRATDHQSSRLAPCEGPSSLDVTGIYRSAELEAEVSVIDTGGVLYGGFSGFLGAGRMEPLQPFGPDVWLLPCPRALDHTPPGDWTLRFQRNAAGEASFVTVGCWLARNLVYDRIG